MRRDLTPISLGDQLKAGLVHGTDARLDAFQHAPNAMKLFADELQVTLIANHKTTLTMPFLKGAETSRCFSQRGLICWKNRIISRSSREFFGTANTSNPNFRRVRLLESKLYSNGRSSAAVFQAFGSTTIKSMSSGSSPHLMTKLPLTSSCTFHPVDRKSST